MAKRTKAKKTKSKIEMPDLVTVMTKFLERIDALEKKMDQVIGRVASLPAEIKQAAQNSQRSEPAPNFPQNQGRTLYKVICADCGKNCEVPFKPGEGRPVYCKACFVIRKAGHVPQDPDKRSEGPRHPKPVTTIPRGADQAASVLSASQKTSKGKKANAKKAAKKKKK